MNFSFVIPVYQADDRIIHLLKELLSDTKAPICVVDDGSQNKILFQDPVFQNKRVSLLSHAVNMGKGAALKTAFNYILVNFPTITGVVTLDADGQHTVSDALKIGEHVQTLNSLILGVRSFSFFDKNIPIKSRLGNLLTRFVWRILMGSKITDTQTGLRGIPTSLYEKMSSYSSQSI